jgi:hypothetical protein
MSLIPVSMVEMVSLCNEYRFKFLFLRLHSFARKPHAAFTLNKNVWSMQAGVQALGAVIEGCSFATNPEEIAQDVVMDNVTFNNSLAHSVALVIFIICFSSGAIVMFTYYVRLWGAKGICC